MIKMDKQIIGISALMIFIVLIIIYILFVIVLPVQHITMNMIDIEFAEPVEPYDLLDLEEIIEMDGNNWEIVIRLMDIESNETIYHRLWYNIETKEFSDYEYIKY